VPAPRKPRNQPQPPATPAKPGPLAGPEAPARPQASPRTPARTMPIGKPTTSSAAVTTVAPTTGSFELDADTWARWWELNRDPYVAIDPWRELPSTPGGQDAIDDSIDGPSRGSFDAVTHERIAPALRAVLDEDPSQLLRSVTLLALARVGERDGDSLDGSELEETLLAHLSHADQGVSSSACIALGILARPSSLPRLAALLEDGEAGHALVERSEVPRPVRAFAAYGVGLVGQRTENPDVRRYAMYTLLRALVDERDREASADVRVALVNALGLADPSGRTRMENDLVAGHLLSLLTDKREDVLVRAHAPRTLARLAPHVSAEVADEIARTLLAAVEKRGERDAVQQGCVLALGQIGDADEDELDVRVRGTLMDVAVGGKGSLRSYAVIALAQACARAGSGEGDARYGTEQARRFLVKRLARAKSTDRAWVALALGILEHGAQQDREARSAGPSPELRLALRECLQESKSPELVAACSIGTGLAAGGDAAAVVAGRIENVNDDALAHTALALGLTGSPEAIDPLHAVLQRSRHQPDVLEQAALALALLHDDSLIEDLQGLLGECDCLLSRGAVALALGRTRNPRAVEPLLALLEEEGAQDLQKTLAVVALGHLADRQRLPWSSGITTDLNYRADTDVLSDLIELP